MKQKFLLLSFLSILIIALSSFVGTSSFGLSTIDSDIFYSIRLPRVLAAFFVGASLGLAGALFQTLLQNPLAEPYTLGISGGASLGLSISLLLALQPAWLISPLMSALFCMISFLVVIYLSRSMGKWNQKNLLLAGILISFLTSSLTFVLFSILSPYDLQKAVSWMIGAFGSERDLWWPVQALLLVSLATYCFLQHKKIDVFLLGEEISFSFLNHQQRFRILLLVFASLLTAVSVSICGMIAFLGLLAPHFSMLMLKSLRTRELSIASCFVGGILLVLSDLVCKLLFTWVYLPSGIFIALLGAPFMIYFLLKESQYVNVG